MSVIPDSFWTDGGLRRLHPNARLAYLWLCWRADAAGVVSPWPAESMSSGLGINGLDSTKATNVIRRLDKAGCVMCFLGVNGQAVAVARWAIVAPAFASPPGDGDPFPTPGEVAAWEGARRAPFTVVPRGGSRRTQAAPSAAERGAAVSVLDHYRDVRAARRPEAVTVIDEQRVALVVTRLREGWQPAMLMKAVRGVFGSAWHMGQNPKSVVYDDLGLVLRDAEHIERFIAIETAAAGGDADDEVSGVLSEMAERQRKGRHGRSVRKDPPGLAGLLKSLEG